MVITSLSSSSTDSTASSGTGSPVANGRALKNTRSYFRLIQSIDYLVEEHEEVDDKGKTKCHKFQLMIISCHQCLFENDYFN